MPTSLIAFSLGLLAMSALSAAEVKKGLAPAKKAHMVMLAYYVTGATPADETAIVAEVKKVKSVASARFDRPRQFVRVNFDSHVVSYHEVAQAILDAGKLAGKSFDPRLKINVVEYPLGDNAAKVDAIFNAKRLNQRVKVDAVDKSKGDFTVRFLPLERDPAEIGPQGFNGGHINHPIHDPPPRGLGLTCKYDAGPEPEKK